jgi:calcium-dependent protein kinase
VLSVKNKHPSPPPSPRPSHHRPSPPEKQTQAVLSQEINWEAPELQVLSPAARSFLQRLLQRNPLLRPSAAEALEDPWLAAEGMASDVPLKVRGPGNAPAVSLSLLCLCFLLGRNPQVCASLRPRSQAREHCTQYLEKQTQGSVVARLQRFATYGHLKQLVLRMITEDMRRRGTTPSLAAAMQVCVGRALSGVSAAGLRSDAV